MTLEIRIEAVVPGAWGWTWAGGEETFNAGLNRALGVASTPARLIRWTLDPERGLGTNQHGHVVGLRPFLGTIGLAPAAPGWHSAWPPRLTGGNMDCKELVAGSTLYLPIAAPGALVSVGDGHAAQGDGEVGGTAIECPMERVELCYVLHDELSILAPRASTPAGWITFGFGGSLDHAAEMALDGMLGFLQEHGRLLRADALALASVVVDLRVTQMVNGIRGVHAILSHGALRQLDSAP